MKLLNEIIWSHLSPILLTQEQNYIPTSHCISIYHLWVSRANMNSKNVLPQTIKFLISPHPMSLQYQEKFNSNPQNSLEQEQALKPYYTRVQFNRPFLDAKSPTICFHFFKYSLKIGLGQLCQNQHIPRTRIRAKQRKKKKTSTSSCTHLNQTIPDAEKNFFSIKILFSQSDQPLR